MNATKRSKAIQAYWNQHLTVDQQINAIRRNAGNPMTQCPTCAGAANLPYRRHDADGHIVEGCIDAFHSDALTPTTNTYAWHVRKEAVALRRAELARLSR